MTFSNEKKTFLAKADKSKKGNVDERVLPLMKIVNADDDYYTTSSCSGRSYLWTGTGKKNETKWIKVSHELIEKAFFDIEPQLGIVWLRVEPFILHVACKDLDAANKLLEKAKRIYKKSCLLSASNKIIVEVRGSEFVEMPFYKEDVLLYSGDMTWLAELVNQKLEKMWQGIDTFTKVNLKKQK